MLASSERIGTQREKLKVVDLLYSIGSSVDSVGVHDHMLAVAVICETRLE